MSSAQRSERDVRKRPRHPRVERVMQEQVRQQGRDTPPSQLVPLYARTFGALEAKIDGLRQRQFSARSETEAPQLLGV